MSPEKQQQVIRDVFVVLQQNDLTVDEAVETVRLVERNIFRIAHQKSLKD